jgi:hypothetical protein
MSDKELQKEIDRMTEELYEEPREDSYLAMVSEFYSRKHLETALIVWGNFLLFFALGIGCAVMFFLSSIVRDQIMYAALFVCFMQWSTLIKVYAWQVMQKIQVKREIKRLELRVAELTQTVRSN